MPTVAGNPVCGKIVWKQIGPGPGYVPLERWVVRGTRTPAGRSCTQRSAGSRRTLYSYAAISGVPQPLRRAQRMAADGGASLAFVKASQSCVISAPLEEAWAAVRECGPPRLLEHSSPAAWTAALAVWYTLCLTWSSVTAGGRRSLGCHTWMAARCRACLWCAPRPTRPSAATPSPAQAATGTALGLTEVRTPWKAERSLMQGGAAPRSPAARTRRSARRGWSRSASSRCLRSWLRWMMRSTSCARPLRRPPPRHPLSLPHHFDLPAAASCLSLPFHSQPLLTGGLPALPRRKWRLISHEVCAIPPHARSARLPSCARLCSSRPGPCAAARPGARAAARAATRARAAASGARGAQATINPFVASFVNYLCTLHLHKVTVTNQTFFSWQGARPRPRGRSGVGRHALASRYLSRLHAPAHVAACVL